MSVQIDGPFEVIQIPQEPEFSIGLGQKDWETVIEALEFRLKFADNIQENQRLHEALDGILDQLDREVSA